MLAAEKIKDQLHSLVSKIPGIVYRCTCEDNWPMLFISDNIEEISGYPPSDFIDNSVRTFESIIHSEDSQMAAKVVLDATERKEPFEVEYRIVNANGTVKWVYERGQFVYSDIGQALCIDGAIFDITERNQAESKLQDTLSFLGDIIENSHDGIVATDKKGFITRSNKAFQEMTGYSEEEILGKHIGELSPLKVGTYKSTTGETIQIGEEFFIASKDMIAELYEKKNISRWDVYLLKKDRKVVPVEESLVLLYNAREEMTGGIGIIRNITERKQFENNLRQVQKMESVGTLAGGVAHEFNNILGGITGYTEIAIDDASEDSPVRESLDEILKLSNRARDVVKQILAFSRKGDKELKPRQPHLTIEESLKVLRATIPTTIEIKQNLDENSGTILTDPTQINQVGMNLCMNAAHAMEESGGVLEIRLSPVFLDAEDVKPYPDLETGEYVKLTVSDTGTGIDPNNIGKIFDPFFTTKGVGKGTGMGLSVVHGIIKDHGGEITVSSKLGEGTTFTVFLPKVESKSKETKIDDAIPTGTENILVVDDEEHLVFLMKTILGRLGYKVTALTNSLEALNLFKKDPQRYDLIITDLTMPHLTGEQLASEVIAIRSDMPVIIATGYTYAVDDEKVKQSDIKAFIPKPCQKQELARTIRLILDEK